MFALQVLLLPGLPLTPAQGQNLTMIWELTPKSDAVATFESAIEALMEFR
jgi:hypothetical protein